MADLIDKHPSDQRALTAAYQTAFRDRFSSRLALSGLIRYVAYSPILSTTAVRMLSASKSLRAVLARKTRSAGTATGG
jgi:hypothetical protein